MSEYNDEYDDHKIEIEREKDERERLRKQRQEMREEMKKLKNVTIRGIDSDVYEEFATNIKSLNRNIGEAVTQMMKDILQDFDGTFPTLSSRRSLGKLQNKMARISHHDHLSISKRDLEEAGMVFSFRHIEKLTFEPDVDLETFNKHVRDIRHCSRVRIPDFLPKLLLLSRIQYCDDVNVYPVDEQVKSTNSSYYSSEEE